MPAPKPVLTHELLPPRPTHGEGQVPVRSIAHRLAHNPFSPSVSHSRRMAQAAAPKSLPPQQLRCAHTAASTCPHPARLPHLPVASACVRTPMLHNRCPQLAHLIPGIARHAGTPPPNPVLCIPSCPRMHAPRAANWLVTRPYVRPCPCYNLFVLLSLVPQHRISAPSAPPKPGPTWSTSTLLMPSPRPTLLTH